MIFLLWRVDRPLFSVLGSQVAIPSCGRVAEVNSPAKEDVRVGGGRVAQVFFSSAGARWKD